MKGSLNDITCISPFRNIYIDNNGRISSCCYTWLPTINGNLLEHSLKDIIQNDVSIDIRKSMRNTNFKYCDKSLCPSLSIYQNTGRISSWLSTQSEFQDLHPSSLSKNLPVELFLNYDLSCNLTCPSCRNELILYKRNEQPSKLQNIHQKVMDGLDHLLEDGHKVILNITGSGDPFASPFFWDMIIRESFFNRVGLHLQTNGVLMTPKRLEHPNILENTMHLQVSIDAFSEETYNKVRRNGNFVTLKENLAHLDQLISEGKFKYLKGFKVNFIVQENNYKEIVSFAKWALNFKNMKHAWFNAIADWGHFPPGTFDKSAVWKDSHPLHDDFLDAINDDVLEHEHIDLGNISPYYEKAKGRKKNKV